MSDRRIEQLLKMVREIEMLESSEQDESARLQSQAPTSQQQAFITSQRGPISFAAHPSRADEILEANAAASRRRWRSMVTAAAVVLLGGLSWQLLAPIMQPGIKGPVAVRPHFDVTKGSTVVAGADSGSRESSKAITPLNTTQASSNQVPRLIAAQNNNITQVAHSPGHDPLCSDDPAHSDPAVQWAKLFGGDHNWGTQDHYATPEVASRIITFSLDSTSDCRCSQTVLTSWDAHASAGRLTEVSRSELLRLGFESSCISEPDRVMVMAVTGPIDELPTSDEDIAALVSCVDPSRSDEEIGYLCHDEVDYKSAAMQCLAHGLKVEVASLMAR